MAWTYTTLKTAIHNWTENDGAEFTAVMDDFIMLAEDRILREADLDRYRKFSTTNLTIGDRFLTKPSDFLLDRWMAIVDGSGKRSHLISKDNSFMNEYWPDITVTGTPKFYADWDEKTFIIAAPADDSYEVELAFTYRPQGLAETGTTTWISTNAPRCIFAATMVEAGIFNKMDDAEIQMWEGYYDRALKGLIQEQMSRQRTNENETGEIR